jgi:hypothetical protein
MAILSATIDPASAVVLLKASGVRVRRMIKGRLKRETRRKTLAKDLIFLDMLILLIPFSGFLVLLKALLNL